MILGKFEAVLIAFLVISIAFNFILAYKIDKIKEEVIDQCNKAINLNYQKYSYWNPKTNSGFELNLTTNKIETRLGK